MAYRFKVRPPRFTVQYPIPSNLQIVEAARKVTGHPIPLEMADRRPGDPDTLIASSEKARAILGWQPKFDNIETIIQTAWAWHSSHPDGYNDR